MTCRPYLFFTEASWSLDEFYAGVVRMRINRRVEPAFVAVTTGVEDRIAADPEARLDRSGSAPRVPTALRGRERRWLGRLEGFDVWEVDRIESAGSG